MLHGTRNSGSCEGGEERRRKAGGVEKDGARILRDGEGKWGSGGTKLRILYFLTGERLFVMGYKFQNHIPKQTNKDCDFVCLFIYCHSLCFFVFLFVLKSLFLSICLAV